MGQKERKKKDEIFYCRRTGEEGRKKILSVFLPVGKGGIFGHGNGDEVAAGVGSGLVDGRNDLLGLADADADVALLVADDDDGAEMELLAAFDDLGDPADLDDALLEPIPDLLLLALGAEAGGGLLDLGVHDVDVVAEDTDPAVGRAVDLLVGGGDLVLRLRGTIVEARGRDVPLGPLGRLEGVILLRVEVIEEGGVNVRSFTTTNGKTFGGRRQMLLPRKNVKQGGGGGAAAAAEVVVREGGGGSRRGRSNSIKNAWSKGGEGGEVRGEGRCHHRRSIR